MGFASARVLRSPASCEVFPATSWTCAIPVSPSPWPTGSMPREAASSGWTQAGARAVVAGGTGLYVTALVDGFDLARVPPDPERRVERGEVAATPDGLDVLAAELRRRDPDGAATIDQRNPRRVIRALEILDAGGGSVLATRTRSAPRASVLVGLDVARPEHERWIEHRTASMFDTGALQDEVRRLLAQGLDPHTIGGCGIGYQEALANLEGRLGLDAAKEATVRRTLRYARAQRTWFRRDSRIRWFRPDLDGVDRVLDDVLTFDRQSVE